jgi:aspartate racemase
MKMLGLIGGTTYVSTIEYYRTLNEMANEKLGGVDAARLLLWSLNFGDLQRNNLVGDQEANFKLILEAGTRLESAGAAGIMICANTLHMFADRLGNELTVPIINLMSATVEEAKRQNLKSLLLLGTKYTMNGAFYHEPFEAAGIRLVVPEIDAQEHIHRAIYEEMSINIFSDSCKRFVTGLIEESARNGVEGVIMGCTEIPVLLQGYESPIPLLDTALEHCKAAIRFATRD